MVLLPYPYNVTGPAGEYGLVIFFDFILRESGRRDRPQADPDHRSARPHRDPGLQLLLQAVEEVHGAREVQIALHKIQLSQLAA